MNKQLKWLEWAKQIQAIAQTGLAYSRDIYDIERFEQLRTLSVDIMQEYTDVESEMLIRLFAGEHGYATPKVDVRGVIFRENEILMVKEKAEGEWSLPGGWADIGLSPSEIAVKEVREESGFEVRPVRLLAVLDNLKHNPPGPYQAYKIFIACEITGGGAAAGLETSDVRFFAENELPALSQIRNSDEQIRMMFELKRHPEHVPLLD